MATLTVQNLTLSGLELSTSSAGASGDVFTNDGRTLLYVNNGAGSDITVTITAQDTSEEVQGMGTVSIADSTITVTAGEDRYIGFFPQQRFNNSSGQVAVTYSSATSVTVSAIRTPMPGKTQ